MAGLHVAGDLLAQTGFSIIDPDNPRLRIRIGEDLIYRDAELRIESYRLNPLGPRFTQFKIAQDGNVGIGTGTPTSKLDIAAQDGLAIRGFRPFYTLHDTSTNRRVRMQAVNGDINFQTDNLVGSAGSSMLIQNNTGNVGIGTTNPENKLALTANVPGFNGTAVALQNTDRGNTNKWFMGAGGTFIPADGFAIGDLADYRLVINGGNGNVGIGTVEPTQKLDVVGDVRVRGRVRAIGFGGRCFDDIVPQLPVRAPVICNQDVAETFATREATEPGDLVVLVNESASTPTVRKSTQPYEGVLVGAVSTNPGLVFDRGETHLAGDNSNLITKEKTVVGLVGRVPVKVSLENGAITVGDPLTSSSTAGVAMKATKAGQIVGYAMEKAEQEGKVLVHLQPGYYMPPKQLAQLNQMEELKAEVSELQRLLLTVLAQRSERGSRTSDVD